MAAVQSLRKKAAEAGTLKTTKEQKVVVEQEAIVIESASPQVVSVPTYNPTVAYGAWPYPAYPPACYYPPGYAAGTALFSFGMGMAVGAAWGYAWGDCDWHGGDVDVDVNRNTNINNNINRGNYAKLYQGRRGSWQHNPEHRKGVSYPDQGTAQKYKRASTSEAIQSRENFRGRAERVGRLLPAAELIRRGTAKVPGNAAALRAGQQLVRPGGGISPAREAALFQAWAEAAARREISAAAAASAGRACRPAAGGRLQRRRIEGRRPERRGEVAMKTDRSPIWANSGEKTGMLLSKPWRAAPLYRQESFSLWERLSASIVAAGKPLPRLFAAAVVLMIFALGGADTIAASGPKGFTTPEEAVQAFVAAMKSNDQSELLSIVDAQREYAMKDRDGDGIREYAEKFGSDPGKKNGLYWERAPGEEPSPLGELVAKARAEGYRRSGTKQGPIPFHGYFFRILTRQGKHAAGGAFDYLVKKIWSAGLPSSPIRPHTGIPAS
jgi:hypothetical protein